MCMFRDIRQCFHCFSLGPEEMEVLLQFMYGAILDLPPGSNLWYRMLPSSFPSPEPFRSSPFVLYCGTIQSEIAPLLVIIKHDSFRPLQNTFSSLAIDIVQNGTSAKSGGAPERGLPVFRVQLAPVAPSYHSIANCYNGCISYFSSLTLSSKQKMLEVTWHSTYSGQLSHTI